MHIKIYISDSSTINIFCLSFSVLDTSIKHHLIVIQQNCVEKLHTEEILKIYLGRGEPLGLRSYTGFLIFCDM